MSDLIIRGPAEADAAETATVATDAAPPRAARSRVQAHSVNLRLQQLERQATYGIAAFLVLNDLLLNVRSSGGLTTHLVDETFAELLDYFRTVDPDHPHPIVAFIEGMRTGEFPA